MKKIILVGFMGSGKSTIGKRLSEELALPFCEMDELIEKQAQKTISAIFDEEGEESFRQIETEVLKMILEQEAIIATGGGAITKQENIDLLNNEKTVIYLNGHLDSLMTNIMNDKKNKRPLADSAKKETLACLLKTREPHYKKVADIILDINGKEIEEIVEEIVEQLKGMEL